MKKRALVFAGTAVLTAVLLCFFAKLLPPVWTDWNHDNTVKGIYREPENSLQVLFLGTSQVANGISPVTLYDEYGIAAYDLGTVGQPMLSSCYWLQEVWRLQGGSLKTVVLDLSSLFKEDTEYNYTRLYNEQALLGMKLSPVKYAAMKDLSETYSDFRIWENIFPLIRYHARWSKLEADDFRGIRDLDSRFCTRGQNPVLTMARDVLPETAIRVPTYGLTETADYTAEEMEAAWDPGSREYLERIISFCDEKGIRLVFIKTPKLTSELLHDACEYMAELYGIPFLDLNSVDALEEMDLSFPYDYKDKSHPNVYGAQKISLYIGRFLAENGYADDLRDDPGHAYLREQSEEFGIVMEAAELQRCGDLGRYLELLDRDRYTVYLSVKDEAADGLTEKDREMLAGLGFEGIRDLEHRCAYIGIVDRGATVLDEVSSDPEEKLIAGGYYDRNGQCVPDEVYRQRKTEYEAHPLIEDGRFFMKSAGFEGGNAAEIVIDEEYLADGRRGLNFVVYDHELHQYADRSAFDTHREDRPRTDLAMSSVYISRLDGAKFSGAQSPSEYVALAGDEYTVILCGTMKKESDVLGTEELGKLREYGFSGAEALNGAPYTAIWRKGTVIAEETAGEDGKLRLAGRPTCWSIPRKKIRETSALSHHPASPPDLFL